MSANTSSVSKKKSPLTNHSEIKTKVEWRIKDVRAWLDKPEASSDSSRLFKDPLLNEWQLHFNLTEDSPDGRFGTLSLQLNRTRLLGDWRMQVDIKFSSPASGPVVKKEEFSCQEGTGQSRVVYKESVSAARIRKDLTAKLSLTIKVSAPA